MAWATLMFELCVSMQVDIRHHLGFPRSDSGCFSRSDSGRDGSTAIYSYLWLEP
jgi:hypothetical protein